MAFTLVVIPVAHFAVARGRRDGAPTAS